MMHITTTMGMQQVTGSGKLAGAVKDPVCGMTVEAETVAHRARYNGHEYHFCSVGCRTKLLSEPGRYVAGHVAAQAAPPGTIFTCPMHLEIR